MFDGARGEHIVTANKDLENSQTVDDVAARQRELIGLCAARTAGLDGASAQRYASDIRNRLLLWPRPQAHGTMLPLEKGIRQEFLRQLGPWLLGPPVLSATLALSIPNFWIQSIFIAVILLAFGLPLRLVEVSNWRDKLSGAWSAMLPEAGAVIRADSECLTIGALAVPWDDVRLEAVELQYLWRPRINPKYRVDQLRLATSRGALALDVRLIENGREVIDTICGNLV